jgi:hypothetical protein
VNFKSLTQRRQFDVTLSAISLAAAVEVCDRRVRPHPPRVDLTRPARTIPVRAGLRFQCSHRHTGAEIGRAPKKDYMHDAPCGSRDPGEPFDR